MVLKKNDSKLKKAMSQFLQSKVEDGKQYSAITFGIKPNTDEVEQQRVIQLVISQINGKLLKSAYKRHDKKLNIFGVLELIHHPHAHLLLEIPDNYSAEQVRSSVQEALNSIDNAQKYFHFKDAYNPEGFLDYISKYAERYQHQNKNMETILVI